MSSNCPSFIPRDIYDNLVDSPPNYKLKIVAIQELHQYVQSLDTIALQPPSHLSFLFPYLSSPNFKISVTSFVILRDILGKLEDSSIEDEIRVIIIPLLIDKWNDGKLVIRHAASSVMAKIASRVLGSHELISILIGYLPHESWNIKEEMINFVIYCLLKHGHSAYDYGEIINTLTKTLKDPKLRVKFVSVEALAVIHSIIGTRIMPYLEQFKQNDAKTYKLLQERFKQSTLPMLSRSTKGVVEHKLLLRLHRQSPQARGRRVQSAYIQQKEGLNSPANNNHQTTETPQQQNSNPTTNGGGYASRYPTKQASSKPPVNNYDEMPVKASMRAHSAPRRLQSDEEYITYNPNTSKELSKSHQDDDDEDDGSSNESEDGDGGYVPLKKPMAALQSNAANNRMYRYRNSVIDVEEDCASDLVHTPKSPSYRIHRTPRSPVHAGGDGSNSSSKEESSKVTLWLSNNRHSSSSEEPPPKHQIPEPSPERSRPSSRVHRNTPRSKRILNLDLGDDEDDEGNSIISRSRETPYGRQRSISLSVTPPSNKVSQNPEPMLSPSRQNAPPTEPLFSAHDDSDSGAIQTTSVRPHILSRTRKRPRPIRVAPSQFSSAAHTPEESPNRLSQASQNSSQLSSPSKGLEFVEHTDLVPCSAPSSVIKRAIEELSSSNWEARFHAVTDVRRVTVHHGETITPHLHDIVALVSKYMLDLRSLLSKNAIVCMNELFQSQGRQMDSNLPRVIPLLLKKTGEANRFINQEADATLRAMVQYANTEKCLVLLLPFGSDKNSIIRLSTAQIVSEAAVQLDVKLFRFKDLKKLFTVIMSFIHDSSAGVRNCGRKIALTVFRVYSNTKRLPFDRFLIKYLTSHEMNAFMDAVEKAEKGADSTRTEATPRTVQLSMADKPTRQMGTKRYSAHPSRNSSPGSSKSSPRSTVSADTSDLSITNAPITPSKPAPRRKKRIMRAKKAIVVKKLMDDKTNDELKDVYTMLDSNDWRDRLQGLMEVTLKIQENVGQFGEYETTKVMDHFTPRMVDANVKVSERSFRCLSQITPHLANHLSPFLFRILQNTCTSLGANNPKVQKAASDAFDSLASHVDKISLLSHLPQLVVSNNTKVRGLLIQKYSTIVEEAYELKPEAVVRYVVPIAFKLAKNSKSVVKNNNMEMMRVLHQCMGKELFIHAHSLDIDVLERLERNLMENTADSYMTRR